MSEAPAFVPLEFRRYPADEMRSRARAFREEMTRRRTVRDFAAEPVPTEVIDECLRVAGSAPNGANRQPWHFVVVTDPRVKRKIREAAEDEERAFYEDRAPDEWLEALAPLGTGPEKPFLEDASHLIVIFAQRYGLDSEGGRRSNYYVNESVGIATGMLIAALHHAGVATLTHTPSPMGFLNRVLGRPESERPFLILVAGYPEEDARVPRIRKKALGEITTRIEGPAEP